MLKKVIGRINLLLIFFLMTGLPVLAQESGQRKPPTFWEFLFQPKFTTMLILAVWVLFLLKSKRMKNSIKVPLLLLSTLLYGVIGNLGIALFDTFSMHPSPMCAASKPFLFGFRTPFLVMLSVMFFLTLVGPKLFCGWICPVGTTQELIAMWADKLKIKRKQFRFSLSYGIRLSIFLVFIFTGATGLLKQTVGDNVIAVNIYDYINPFHGFEFQWTSAFITNVINYLPFLLTVILAFKFYRPFCHYVCPIGLYANFLEQIGLFRITLRKKSCTDCQVCEKLSPCQAVPDIMQESTLRPDCYACDVCVKVCPEDALEYGIKKRV